MDSNFQKRTFSTSSYTNSAAQCLRCTLYYSFILQLYSFLLLYLYFVYISSCTTVLFFTDVPVLCIHFQLYTVLFITAVPVLCIYLQLYHCTLYYCCNCTFHKFSSCTHCTLQYCCTCTLYTFPAVPLYSLLMLYLYFA